MVMLGSSVGEGNSLLKTASFEKGSGVPPRSYLKQGEHEDRPSEHMKWIRRTSRIVVPL